MSLALAKFLLRLAKPPLPRSHGAGFGVVRVSLWACCTSMPISAPWAEVAYLPGHPPFARALRGWLGLSIACLVRAPETVWRIGGELPFPSDRSFMRSLETKQMLALCCLVLRLHRPPLGCALDGSCE